MKRTKGGNKKEHIHIMDFTDICHRMIEIPLELIETSQLNWEEKGVWIQLLLQKKGRLVQLTKEQMYKWGEPIVGPISILTKEGFLYRIDYVNPDNENELLSVYAINEQCPDDFDFIDEVKTFLSEEAGLTIV